MVNKSKRTVEIVTSSNNIYKTTLKEGMEFKYPDGEYTNLNNEVTVVEEAEQQRDENEQIEQLKEEAKEKAEQAESEGNSLGVGDLLRGVAVEVEGYLEHKEAIDGLIASYENSLKSSQKEAVAKAIEESKEEIEEVVEWAIEKLSNGQKISLEEFKEEINENVDTKKYLSGRTVFFNNENSRETNFISGLSYTEFEEISDSIFHSILSNINLNDSKLSLKAIKEALKNDVRKYIAEAISVEFKAKEEQLEALLKIFDENESLSKEELKEKLKEAGFKTTGIASKFKLYNIYKEQHKLNSVFSIGGVEYKGSILKKMETFFQTEIDIDSVESGEVETTYLSEKETSDLNVTLSTKIKILMSGLTLKTPKGATQYDSLGFAKYQSTDTVVQALREAMTGTNTDLNTLVKALEERAGGTGRFSDVYTYMLERINSAPEYLRNELINKFTGEFMVMSYILKSTNRDGNLLMAVYEANNMDQRFTLKDTFASNFKNLATISIKSTDSVEAATSGQTGYLDIVVYNPIFAKNFLNKHAALVRKISLGNNTHSLADNVRAIIEEEYVSRETDKEAARAAIKHDSTYKDFKEKDIAKQDLRKLVGEFFQDVGIEMQGNALNKVVDELIVEGKKSITGEVISGIINSLQQAAYQYDKVNKINQDNQIWNQDKTKYDFDATKKVREEKYEEQEFNDNYDNLGPFTSYVNNNPLPAEHNTDPKTLIFFKFVEMYKNASHLGVSSTFTRKGKTYNAFRERTFMDDVVRELNDPNSEYRAYLKSVPYSRYSSLLKDGLKLDMGIEIISNGSLEQKGAGRSYDLKEMSERDILMTQIKYFYDKAVTNDRSAKVFAPVVSDKTNTYAVRMPVNKLEFKDSISDYILSEDFSIEEFRKRYIETKIIENTAKIQAYLTDVDNFTQEGLKKVLIQENQITDGNPFIQDCILKYFFSENFDLNTFLDIQIISDKSLQELYVNMFVSELARIISAKAFSINISNYSTAAQTFLGLPALNDVKITFEGEEYSINEFIDNALYENQYSNNQSKIEYIDSIVSIIESQVKDTVLKSISRTINEAFLKTVNFRDNTGTWFDIKAVEAPVLKKQGENTKDDAKDESEEKTIVEEAEDLEYEDGQLPDFENAVEDGSYQSKQENKEDDGVHYFYKLPFDYYTGKFLHPEYESSSNAAELNIALMKQRGKLSEEQLKANEKYNGYLRFQREVTMKLAYDFIVNNMIAQRQLSQVLYGDNALFGVSDRKYSKREDGTFDPYSVAVAVSDNQHKRFAGVAAQGTLFANSENDSYIQVFVNDNVTPTTNPRYLLNLHYFENVQREEAILDEKGNPVLEEVVEKNEKGEEIKKQVPKTRIVKERLLKQDEAERYETITKLLDEYEEETTTEDRRDSIIKEIKKLDTRIADFFDITGTDAQEYVTWQEHLDLIYRKGGLTDQQKERIEEITKKLENNEELTGEELNYVLNPMKLVYTGSVREELVNRFVYVKSSTIPLLPQLTAGTKLESVRQTLERLQKEKGKKVRLSYQSANKVGAVNSSLTMEDMYTKSFDELSQVLEDSSLELKRKYLRYQQDTPYKTESNLLRGKEDYTTEGTQMWRILMGSGVNQIQDKIFKNIFDKVLLREINEEYNLGIDVDAEKLSGQEIDQIKFYIEKYHGDYKLKTFFRQFGFNPDGSIGNPKKMIEKMRSILLDEATSRNYDQTTIDSLRISIDSLEEYMTSMPLWLNNSANRIENLLQSIIDSRFMKEKLPGYMHVTASSEGMYFDEEKGKLNVNSVDDLSQAERNGIIWLDAKRSGELQSTVVANPLSVFSEENGKKMYLHSLDENGTATVSFFTEEVTNENGQESVERKQGRIFSVEFLNEKLGTIEDIIADEAGEVLVSKIVQNKDGSMTIEVVQNGEVQTLEVKDNKFDIFKDEAAIKESEVLIQSKFRKRVFEDGVWKMKLIDLREYTEVVNGRLVLKQGVIDDELLTNFSFRIPTSTHQSGAILRVVGFLPESSGDTIVVPKEHTTQIGEDYDIDKRTLYKSNYFVEDGKIKKLKLENVEGALNEFVDEEVDSILKTAKRFRNKGNSEVLAAAEAYDRARETKNYEKIEQARLKFVAHMNYLVNRYYEHKYSFGKAEQHVYEELRDNYEDIRNEEDNGLSEEESKKIFSKTVKSIYDNYNKIENKTALGQKIFKVAKESMAVLESNADAETIAKAKNDFLNKIVSLFKESNEEISQFEYAILGNREYLMNKKKMLIIENAKIDVYKSVFSSTDDRVQKLVSKVLSMDKEKASANVIENEIHGLKEVDSSYSIYGDSVFRRQLKVAADGKIGTGVFSNAVVENAQYERLPNDKKVRLVELNKEGEVVNREIKIGGYTFKGTFGTISTLDGKRTIADSLQAAQNMSLNNIKALVMGKINLNKHTMPVYDLMVKMGFDLDATSETLNGEGHIPSFLLSQPIIRRYVEMVENNKSVFNDKRLTDDQIAARLKYEFNKLGHFNTAKKKASLGSFKKTEILTVDNMFKGLKNNPNDESYYSNKEAVELQLTVLNTFMNLKKIAEEMTDLRDFVNSTKGFGKSYFDTLLIVEKIKNSKYSEKVQGISNLIGDVLNKGEFQTLSEEQQKEYVEIDEDLFIKPETTEGVHIVNGIMASKSLLSVGYPFDSNAISEAIDDIVRNANANSNSSYNREAFRYNIISALKDYMYSFGNTGLFSGNVEDVREKLFFDRNGNESLASFLERFRNKHRQFSFLKSLDLKFVDKSGKMPSLIRLTRANEKSFDKQDSYFEILSMLENENSTGMEWNGNQVSFRDVAMAFVQYSILANTANGAIGFRSAIPTSYLEDISFGVSMRKMNANLNKMLLDNFKKQFFQHNKNHVTMVKLYNKDLDSVQIVDNSGGLNIQNISAKTGIYPADNTVVAIKFNEKETPSKEFIKVYIGVKKVRKDIIRAYALFQNVGSSVYHRIHELGDYGFNEYDPHSSNVKSAIEGRGQVFENEELQTGDVVKRKSFAKLLFYDFFEVGIELDERGRAGFEDHRDVLELVSKKGGKFDSLVSDILDASKARGVRIRMIFKNRNEFPKDLENSPAYYAPLENVVYVTNDIFKFVYKDKGESFIDVLQEVISEEVIHAMTVETIKNHIETPEGEKYEKVKLKDEKKSPSYLKELVGMYNYVLDEINSEIEKGKLSRWDLMKKYYYAQNLEEFVAGAFFDNGIREFLQGAYKSENTKEKDKILLKMLYNA